MISAASTAHKVAALSARPDVALAIDAGGTPEFLQHLASAAGGELVVSPST